MKKNSKIYIAGHKGLVGSALWKTLQNKGYTNLIGRTLEELDLMDQAAVANFFETEKPEYVILAAAKVGGIIANNTYRGQFIYENLQIQNNVIHQSYVHGVKKLLFLGSTCIYPKNAPQPMSEDCLLTGELEYTNEPYAIAKIAGLKLCEAYNLQYGTNFISVMPTNLYGPNDNFNLETSHVLPAMVRKIHLAKCLEDSNWDAIRDDLNKRPVEGIDGSADQEEILFLLKKYGIHLHHSGADEGTRLFSIPSTQVLPVSLYLWGSGKPMREFLWSEDMAEACVFLLENRNFEDVRTDGDEVRNTHINIGTGIEIAIHQLAETIQKTIGFTGAIEFDRTKPDGTMRKLTDPSKLHQLGWKHKIELEEGIRLMYQHYLA
ncbi:GDP-L-fucose synthase family protein [Sunxiuqinia dokdonensis]|uniref:GDP-L-fucose synthase n=1 Tax=Sunxiuqinia dokdonensis TaxID=1409788 RepID=A0A0L8VDI1_9BACT|nr:GDP-L-fucose synthase [Sunxiuqinia dokdonensis]KOH46540.1 GDP-4-keto-6-deoxy-D-mannose-3, 5-epimerase-4-reductase [Sunxiuqinia dokdonensis]